MRRASLTFAATMVLMILWAVAYSAPAVTTVTLRAQAEVRPARPVAVKDIARILGPAAAKVGEIVVTTAPVPGKVSRVSSDLVRRRVSADTKVDVKIAGVDSVELIGKCARFGPDILAEEARALIASQLPDDGCDYDVAVDRAPREIVVAGGDSSALRARMLNPTLRPGTVAVTVDAIVDERVAASSTVSLTVKAMASVLVATKAIRQGEELTPDNTEWDRRDVTRKPDALVQSREDTTGWVARRALSTGTMITGNDVAPPYAVLRGETASLTVRCGGVTLHTTGEIKADARTGELVKVRPADATEDVQAKVLGPGLVCLTR